ncbi:MAG: hypothetical protein HOG04_10925 [Nitrospinaceae bacterium]|nr:hypothetical protein [Nitrospinaceae bacterium]
MPWFSKSSSNGSQQIRFSFSRQQFALFIGGAFILLTISFSMGFFVADRQAGVDDKTAFASSSTSGSPTIEAEATVKIAPKLDSGTKTARAGTSRADVSNVIKPSFYKELLDKNEPSPEKLAPLKLPTAPMTTVPKKVQKLPKPVPLKNPSVGKTANTPKSVVAPRPPRVAARPRYTIQVVSVKEPAYALKIHKKLREKGFAVFIQRVDLKAKGVWLRIRVGKFSDKKAAAQVLRALHAKTTVRGGQIVPL